MKAELKHREGWSLPHSHTARSTELGPQDPLAGQLPESWAGLALQELGLGVNSGCSGCSHCPDAALVLVTGL